MTKRKTLDAMKVADYFIWKSSEEKKSISNKKLQKLLYYSQAWFIVLKNRKLFKDKIEAWVHGPAIRRVYSEFKRFGFGPIEKEIEHSEITELPKNIRDFLEQIWQIYGKFDADYLELLSHSELPWQQAREDLSAQVGSSNVITAKSMKEYYSKLKRKK